MTTTAQIESEGDFVLVDPAIENDEVIARELERQLNNNETVSPELVSDDEVIARELERQLNNNETVSPEFVSDDEAIARELQGQIDREYNENIRRLEKLQNGTSKLNISYEKYRKYENYDGYGDDSEEEGNREDSDWDRFEQIDRTMNSIPRCGYAITKNGDMVTKHDVSLNGQRNMKRLMNLPFNIQTGDGAASHMEISNRVLNGLKRHSQNEEHRENMRRKEKHEQHHKKLHKLPSISLYGVDSYTKGIVQGMMQGDQPLIKELYGVLGEGKEAWIYDGKTSNLSSRRNCAIKIYKPAVCEMKLPESYLDGDYRFSNRYHPNLRMRTVLSIWAEKEAENLKLLRKVGIPCPRVIGLKQNVLLMTRIDEKNYYTPQLRYRHYRMLTHELYSAYEQIVNYMVVMFEKAHLVHGDLSEFNMYWIKDRIVLTDVSQAIDTSHKYALDSLYNDCIKVSEFFKNTVIENVMSSKELFKHITGVSFKDNCRLEKLREQLQDRRSQATV